MSIHFRGKCYRAKDVICNTACYTKWNKSQPKLVMSGKASDVVISHDVAYIYE